MEKMRRSASRDKGSRSACLNCRQVARLEAGSGVAHPEDPAMNGDESALREPRPYLLGGDAGAQEFGAGDDPV